ncbi:MAG: glycosyltransferase family 4 protein [Bacteroidota bacterium]
MANDPLHILLICPKFPYPKVDGGAIAMYNMMRGFHDAGVEVSVLGMSTPKHPVMIRDFPPHIRELANLHAIDVDTTPRPIDALASFAFSKTKSYHVQRFTSKAFKEELKFMLDENRYDVIQLETLYMLPYIETIKSHCAAKDHPNRNVLISYRAHNIEHEIWKRRAQNEKRPWMHYLYAETARRIERFERKQLEAGEFHVLVPITGRDGKQMKSLGCERPFQATVSGVIMDEVEKFEVKPEIPSVFYLGSLDWEPNKEGLRWFLKFVWPIVHRRYPHVPFYIAGRKMPNEFLQLKKQNIRPLGEVESAAKFMQEKGIMVSPIFSGSGMRIKIIEGMSHGKPIVATRVAKEGIEKIYHGNQMMIADTVEDFANCLSILIEDPNLARTLGIHARNAIKKQFDNKQHIGSLLKFYQDQINKRESDDADKKSDN